MDRIKETFQAQSGKKVLIGYLTAGDPFIGDTVRLGTKMLATGMDILELGVPYSDPLADGPVLQQAAIRAIQSGTTPGCVFNMVRKIRNETEKPIVLLVYYNTILTYGIEEFVRASRSAGVDGLVVPDLPMEHREPLRIEMKRKNEQETEFSLIPLVSKQSHCRIREILKDMTGFVYCVSYSGVTGGKAHFDQEVLSFLEEVRGESHLPIAVGFGIRNHEDMLRLQGKVDGMIVGTAIMEKAKEGEDVLLRFIESELL